MKNNLNMKKKGRIIFHIDMNAFFISCELISKPSLINKAIAISGNNAKFNKGVIVTASYEAREYGVKAAMPVFQARKLCPHLLIIPSNMNLYRECSQKFKNFLKEYTSLIEIASIDEAYLDVTELCKNIHPLALAKEIQQKLLNIYQLPTSIGIAANKFLAKMASDMKKPLGITVLRNKELKEKLWPLKINEMYGIGKKTAPKLIDNDILTIGDIVKNPEKAKKILGNQFNHFYLNALGYGNNIVDPNKNDSYQSIGNSTTFQELITTETVAYKKLKELTQIVVSRLIKHSYLIKTISIQIKYADYKSHTKSYTLNYHTQDISIIYNNVIDLFDELWNKNLIRLLGVNTSNIIEKRDNIEQLNLFTYENQVNNENIIKLMNDINRKFGENTIKRGYKLKK